MKQPNLYFESPIKINNILNYQPFAALANTDKPIRSEIMAPNKFELQIQAILELKRSGKLAQALRRVNVLIDNNPNQMRSYQIKGQITFTLRQYEQSISCYSRLIQMEETTQNSDFPPSTHETPTLKTDNKRALSLYYYNRGLCLQKLERHHEAIISFKEASIMNKQKIQIYLSLADSYRWVGKTDKMMQIFQKLTDKMKNNTAILSKIVEILLEIKDYKSVITFIEKGLINSSSMDQTLYVHLLSAKADSFRKLEEYEESIQTYQSIIQVAYEQTLIINSYFRLAECFEKRMNVIESINCYKQILAMNQNNVEAINNLANLELRQHNYPEAISIINLGILECSRSNSPSNRIKLLLLKAHRIVALMKLEKTSEAAQDLHEVIRSLQEWKCFEMDNSNQWQNYKFIKKIVEKYQDTLEKLDQMQRETDKSENLSKFTNQVKNLNSRLLGSISCELQFRQEDQKDELERLAERINRLHQEIVEFKANTLKENEQNHLRVHTKIQEIEEILERKEEEANKLASEMEQLKKEYADIYKMIKQVKLDDINGQLSKQIKELKAAGKDTIALYAQQLFWVFNAYLVSIRLVANHLVSQGKNILHLKGISSFFARFKGVFETASHVPQIGAVCEAINSLLSLYLNQESAYVYAILNRAIIRSFSSEQELQQTLQSAISDLISSGYIEHALEKSKRDKIRSEMTLYNRAYEWFRKQKARVIKKIMKFEGQQESAQEILVKELVIEDIGSILLFIIRSKESKTNLQTSGDLLKVAFNKALMGNFKDIEITSLYSKQQEKQSQIFCERKGCSQKCQIY